jgi:hypothetical protein
MSNGRELASTAWLHDLHMQRRRAEKWVGTIEVVRGVWYVNFTMVISIVIFSLLWGELMSLYTLTDAGNFLARSSQPISKLDLRL